jgi:hypothetical protein
MAVKKEVNIATYCYDLVLEQFTKGFSGYKNKEGGADAGKVNRWSPNNLRRIVISPDGVMLQYHVVEGTSYPNIIMYVPFFMQGSGGSDNKTRNTVAYFNEPKHTPLINIVVKERVCSCIEEIVFLTNGKQTGISLPPQDYNIAELTKTGNFNTRFSRLHGIVTLNMTMEQFRQALGGTTKLKSDTYMVADDEVFKGYVVGNTTMVCHEDDWWKHTGLRGQYYVLDEKEGILDRKFTRIKAQMEKEIRDDKLKAIKEKAASVDEETESKYIKICKEVAREIDYVSDFMKIVKKKYDRTNVVLLSEKVAEVCEWGNIQLEKKGTFYKDLNLEPDVWKKKHSMAIAGLGVTMVDKDSEKEPSAKVKDNIDTLIAVHKALLNFVDGVYSLWEQYRKTTLREKGIEETILFFTNEDSIFASNVRNNDSKFPDGMEKLEILKFMSVYLSMEYYEKLGGEE